MSMRTWAVVWPFLTSTMVPLRILRALSFIGLSCCIPCFVFRVSPRGARSLADQPVDRAELLGGAGMGRAFDRAVKPDDLLADRRQSRSTSLLAAGRGRDRRLAQRFVDFFHQQPGTAIRHAELPRRR